MSTMNDKRFRPWAVAPLLLSVLSFAFILLLVLSGTRPDLVPDGYLLSFNTTEVGQNLIQFNPAAATPTAVATRDISSRDIVIDSPMQKFNATFSTTQSSNSTSSSSSQNLNSTASTSPNLNQTTSSSVSSAPALSIPATSGTPSPTAIPIGVLGAFFQLVLNGLASGVGDTLKSVITLVVTSSKQQFGVTQYYNMHLLNLCEGSVVMMNTLNTTADPFNITRCVTYGNAGSVIVNLTKSVSASTIVAATNVTVPFLNEVPGLGRSTKGTIDLVSTLILLFFIVVLIGNGLAIILSAVAIFSPQYSAIHSAAAAITTISTTMLQQAAITSTILALSLSSSINKFSNTIGLSATVGSKFLIFIWVGYISAQIANSYWVTVWFVEYRKRSYKARERTPQEIGNYKGIKKEVLSDIKLRKGTIEYSEDTETLWKSGSDGFQAKRRSTYNVI